MISTCEPHGIKNFHVPKCFSLTTDKFNLRFRNSKLSLALLFIIYNILSKTSAMLTENLIPGWPKKKLYMVSN